MSRIALLQAFLGVTFFFSGVAALGYEIVWTRMFSIGLGHEIPGMLAVVAAFFGGFALGAFTLDSRVSRSPNPGRWYAALEATIALWNFALIALIPWANQLVARLMGPAPGPARHWLVAFLVPLFVLLPTTFAMGATLPAIDRVIGRLRVGRPSLGGLYAVNTLGAVTGTLATTFWLVPALGMLRTLVALSIVNLLCALCIFICTFRDVVESDRESFAPSPLDIPGRFRLGTTLFLTGFLGIGYEVLGVRVLAQAHENTVYSFACALAVYLLGTALGAAVYQALALWRWFRPVLTYLVEATSIACLLGILLLQATPRVYESVRELFGARFGGTIAAEILIAAMTFALPALAMGATFSHLVQAARRRNGGVGWALALNTLGGALAPLLVGVVLLPLLGSKWTLAVVSLGYLLLIPEVVADRLALAAIPLVLLLLLPANLVFVEPKPGGQVLDSREGVLGTVTVVTDSRQHRFLKVNNRFSMGGTAGTFGEQRQAHIPLLLHRRPRSALFLGLGTGITFGAAGRHPHLTADGVELVPEVVEMLEYFRGVGDTPAERRRLSVTVADARRFVEAGDSKYDVIVADLFHPARDGAGSLYTLEHFRGIRRRLAARGLFCQWLPLYQLDSETLRVILRTFLEVFPHANAFLAHFNSSMPALGLMATPEAVTYPSNLFANRFEDRRFVRSLVQVDLSDSLSLFGGLIADADDLARFAGSGLLNTDDRPVVIFTAPRLATEEPGSGFANLTALLSESGPRLETIITAVDSADDRDFHQRLGDYLAARDAYLNAEHKWSRGARADAIEEYLKSVRTSSEFGPAYAMALVRAQTLARSDLEAARKVLLDLIAANPTRPEARRLLTQLRTQ